jgi:hypothetical protein
MYPHDWFPSPSYLGCFPGKPCHGKPAERPDKAGLAIHIDRLGLVYCHLGNTMMKWAPSPGLPDAFIYPLWFSMIFFTMIKADSIVLDMDRDIVFAADLIFILQAHGNRLRPYRYHRPLPVEFESFVDVPFIFPLLVLLFILNWVNLYLSRIDIKNENIFN